MQKPRDILNTIEYAVSTVLATDALNEQQRTFLNHIHNTAKQLSILFAAIPSTEYALQRIMPTLGDSYEQQLSVIYGYAKMLIEHPASFDDAALTEIQKPHVQAIFDGGIVLAQQYNQLKDAAFDERKAQHKGDAERFDLNMVIWQHVPVLRYFIQNDAVKLNVQLPQGLPPVHVNHYHLIEIIQHIATVIANDLMAFGKLTLTASYADDIVTLQFLAEGLRLSDEVRNTLFAKDGRNAYKKRLEQQHITLMIANIPTLGTEINLGLPIASRINS